MKDLIVRKLSLTLNFKTRKEILKFAEPSIYNLIEFYSLIEEENFISAVRLIIPNIKEKDFLSNPSWIVQWISKLIYWVKKEMEKTENYDEWFLPSIIDLMSHRYWTLPDDLMKKTTFTQLMIFSKGYEWNMNIQNDNEKANVKILMETDDKSKEKLAEELKQAKKDKELLRKMWWMPTIGKN